MKKEHIELLQLIADKNNPKYELNFGLFGSDGFAKATNTKHLIQIELIEPPKEDVYIRKDVLKKALQYVGKKDAFFNIFNTTNFSLIAVYPEKKDEFICGNNIVNGIFPNINRIIGISVEPIMKINKIYELFSEIDFFETTKEIQKTIEYIFEKFNDIYLMHVKKDRDRNICELQFDVCNYVFIYKTKEQVRNL